MRVLLKIGVSALAVGAVISFFAAASASSGADTLPLIQAQLVAPPNVPPPVPRDRPARVKVELETTEVRGHLSDGVEFEFWTFGGTVPGPMIRVREGDTVELSLKNAEDSHFMHSIDLHAVTGPGGGARATQIDPGQEAVFRFQALKPGAYVYHCATPSIPRHVSNGMYGLIVVEPANGFPKVDREFYVMQGDIYTKGAFGREGFQEFSVDKMLAETPDYVVFNGAVDSLREQKALKANVGEVVRIFFGVGGPNLTSSFHVIGEIFDVVYPEAALRSPRQDVQTTLVPAGGATIVEFKLEVPGNYLLVDHSLSRIEKGAVGMVEVSGPQNSEIFQTVKTPSPMATGGH